MGCELWNKQALKSFKAHRVDPFHEVLHPSLVILGTHQGLKSLSRPSGPVRKDFRGVKANARSFHLPLQGFGVCESVMNQSDFSFEGMAVQRGVTAFSLSTLRKQANGQGIPEDTNGSWSLCCRETD